MFSRISPISTDLVLSKGFLLIYIFFKAIIRRRCKSPFRFPAILHRRECQIDSPIFDSSRSMESEDRGTKRMEGPNGQRDQTDDELNKEKALALGTRPSKWLMQGGPRVARLPPSCTAVQELQGDHRGARRPPRCEAAIELQGGHRDASWAFWTKIRSYGRICVFVYEKFLEIAHDARNRSRCSK